LTDTSNEGEVYLYQPALHAQGQSNSGRRMEGFMGFRLTTIVMALCLMSACAAFESDNKYATDVTPDGNIIADPDANIFSGFYVGEISQKTNTCEEADLSLLLADSIEVDVIDVGNTISVQFADEHTADGEQKDDSVSIMFERGGEVAEVYNFEFAQSDADGNALTGSIDVTESGDICATFEVDLKQGKKPKDWPNSKDE